MKSPKLQSHSNCAQTLSRSRSLSVSLFATVLAAGLSAATAFSQGYYPDPQSPLNGNPDLQAIEAKLDSGVTLVLPAPTAPLKTLATDLQLAAAVALAVEDELTTGINDVTVESLVREAAQYRPGKVSRVVSAVVPVIVNNGGTDRELLLETAIGAAATAAGKGAPAVASSAITAIVRGLNITNAGDGLSEVDDIAGAAIEAAQAYAAKTVASAIKATKKASSPQAAAIASAAITAAHNVHADYLIEEITKSAVYSGRAAGVEAQDVASAILDSAAANGLASADSVAQLVAAAMAGGGSEAASKMNLMIDVKYAGDAARLASGKAAITGFSAARSVNPDAAPSAVAAAVAANPGQAAAITAGGVAGAPKYAQFVVAEAMGAAFTHGAGSSLGAIVGAGVRANPIYTSKITTAAIDKVEALNPAAVNAVAAAALSNAPIELAGISAFAAMKAFDQKTIEVAVRGLLGSVLDAAEGVEYDQAYGDIVFRVTRANKAMTAEIVEEAILRADVGGAGDVHQTKLAAVVAGAIAANKKAATEITETALGASGTAEGDALIARAAEVAASVAVDRKAFYKITTEALQTATTPNEALAVVYGASMLNPKGAMAIAAAAAANSSANTADIIDAASGANWKQIPKVTVAVNVAAHVKGNSGADLFEHVADQVMQLPAFAVEVATGAVAAAPQYAHVTAHAAAFRAPSSAGKFIPAIFAFSKLDKKKSDGGDADQPARAAAIMAGAANGILEAGLPEKKELSAIRSAVSSAVKASLLLRGPVIMSVDRSDVLTSNPSGSNKDSVGAAGVITGYISQVTQFGATDIDALTVGAVLTAAGKVAKTYILEIAQAAAQAAASVSGAPSSYVGEGIVTALLSSKSLFKENEIRNAVTYGIQQAIANIPGAGALGVVNYAHHSGTGNPVTSIFDL